MNNKFDELAKGMAQSVTRRQALKKFSVGLAGTILACFGLANTAAAHKIKNTACSECINACLKNGGSLELCADNVCAATCGTGTSSGGSQT